MLFRSECSEVKKTHCFTRWISTALTKEFIMICTEIKLFGFKRNILIFSSKYSFIRSVEE